MNINRLMVSVALGLVVACASGRAEAKNLPYKGSFSGSITSTEIDPNGDGQKTGLIIGGRIGTLGSATVQGGTGDFIFSGPATCPNGHAGSQFTLDPSGAGGSVTRFDSTGDLLIAQITAATFCVDPTLPDMLFFSQTETVRGGTGQFEGATGSVNTTGTERVLFSDVAGDFAESFTATFTGTIITKP